MLEPDDSPREDVVMLQRELAAQKKNNVELTEAIHLLTQKVKHLENRYRALISQIKTGRR
jgi:polyhydroxyalkanoate synthesis regulator phasin